MQIIGEAEDGFFLYDAHILTRELSANELCILMKALDGAVFVKKEGWGYDSKLVALDEVSDVTIQVYQTCSPRIPLVNLRGKVVETLVNEDTKAGGFEELAEEIAAEQEAL